MSTVEVVKDPISETFTIRGLDSDQLAYIVGIVSNSSAVADARGEVGGKPLMPTASQLYPALINAAENHGLHRAVEAVERSQWQWTRRQVRPTRREA